MQNIDLGCAQEEVGQKVKSWKFQYILFLHKGSENMLEGGTDKEAMFFAVSLTNTSKDTYTFCLLSFERLNLKLETLNYSELGRSFFQFPKDRIGCNSHSIKCREGDYGNYG